MIRKKPIYIILCIVLWKYYKNNIVSKPKLYYHKNMSNVVASMPSLHRNIWWTFWAYNSYMQSLLYVVIGYIRDRYSSKKLYVIENIILDDKEEITVSWGKLNKKPEGVLLILHTLCGNYSESAHIATEIRNELNLIPVSYSRRGHSSSLTNPKFNTVGDIDDLIFIINKIKNKYADLPIYAIGLSAGTCLLTQYLSKYNLHIKAAVLISPGYDFEESQDHMPILSSYFITFYIKRFFLYPNKEILKNKNINTYNILSKAKTIKDWHNHQWKYSSRESLEEYYREHNPIHVINNINCPILFINALDDIIFPEKLIIRYTDIIYKCTKAIIVHTNYGSHLGFYENWNAKSWSTEVVKDFFTQYK